jgi:hypothetical protein
VTPEELQVRREAMVRELDEAEARVLALSVAGAEGSYELLCRLRRSRERLLGTGPALKVQVFVPVGASAEERRKAVIAAVAERLEEEDRDD